MPTIVTPRARGPEPGAALPRRLWRLRRLANAVNLSTPVGLAVARLGRAETRPGPVGLWLAEGYRLGFPVASAFTVGNVIITAGRWDVLLTGQPRLLLHEQRHSWQYVACAGLPLIPLYGLAMAWSWLRRRDRWSANVFERLAGLADGGYWPTAGDRR